MLQCVLSPTLMIPIAVTWLRLVAYSQGQQEEVPLTGHGSIDQPVYKQEDGGKDEEVTEQLWKM